MSVTSVSSAVYHTVNFKRVEPKTLEDLPPEKRAEVQVHRAQQNAKLAEYDRKMAEMGEQRIAHANNEVHSRGAPNVVSLTREQALYQIESMSELIQSGEADNTPLIAGNGTQTTSNYRQYVYWLQQHVKELEGAQTKMDVKV